MALRGFCIWTLHIQYINSFLTYHLSNSLWHAFISIWMVYDEKKKYYKCIINGAKLQKLWRLPTLYQCQVEDNFSAHLCEFIINRHLYKLVKFTRIGFFFYIKKYIFIFISINNKLKRPIHRGWCTLAQQMTLCTAPIWETHSPTAVIKMTC